MRTQPYSQPHHSIILFCPDKAPTSTFYHTQSTDSAPPTSLIATNKQNLNSSGHSTTLVCHWPGVYYVINYSHTPTHLYKCKKRIPLNTKLPYQRCYSKNKHKLNKILTYHTTTVTQNHQHNIPIAHQQHISALLHQECPVTP